MGRDGTMDVQMDVSQEGFAGRLDVIEGPSGRRRRCDEDKARIVADSLTAGARVADVARRHGVTRWRHPRRRAGGWSTCSAIFGARSSARSPRKLHPDQYKLVLEDVEVAQGVLDAAQEKAEAAIRGKAEGEARPGNRNRNRGRLPAHLPRVERTIEPESTMCPCGCGEMARIGEDVSERLDVIPAQFRVLVTRRPRYACRRSSARWCRPMRRNMWCPAACRRKR